MSGTIRSFSCAVIGEQSLLIQCCEQILARGHTILAVVAVSPRIREWCTSAGLVCLSDVDELASLAPFDYLFSITNLKIVPAAVLSLPQRMAVNFHDGPLPDYAGLNVPVWALLNGGNEHGITWHQMDSGADTGPVLIARRFPISEDETAFTLNALCYQEGLDAFGELLRGMEGNDLPTHPQDLSRRVYFSGSRRPHAAALLDWSRPAKELERMIRALDFGPYPNPVLLPKVDLGGSFLLARESEIVPGTAGLDPGSIQSIDGNTLTVRCATEALRMNRLTSVRGDEIELAEILRAESLQAGDRLPSIDIGRASSLDEHLAAVIRVEDYWRETLSRSESINVPFASVSTAASNYVWQELTTPSAGDAGWIIASFALLLARLNGLTKFSLALTPSALASAPDWMSRYFSQVVPVPVEISFDEPFQMLQTRIRALLHHAERKQTYLTDLPARSPEVRAAEDPARYPVRVVQSLKFGESEARRLGSGSTLTMLVSDDGRRAGFLADVNRIDADSLRRLIQSLETLQSSLTGSQSELTAGELNLVSEDDRRVLASFTVRRAAGSKAMLPVHEQFEEQAARTPDRVAAVHKASSFSYRRLNEESNRLARHLQSRGLKKGDLAGVMVERSTDILVSILAVMKAGAAYVPLDPVYPAERLAYMIEDAGLRLVITTSDRPDRLDGVEKIVLDDRRELLASYAADNLNVLMATTDLAYVIYTSGSTGRPKGVMVEHGNVANFFAGMDERIGTNPGIWLAVTSISFDISVLELLWTLTRGFTVVVHADRRRNSKPASARRIEFGLFYWNVAGEESENDQDKYRLLLEGARFADSHDFNAVWNPERHFNSFGGLFPNPSVTCAALATITENVSLRAGSCVVPLHSPIRIAEEWAVVDNLSGGRAAISIAAGWAPPDFAIRPESFADAKRVMFESADIVRRLWRGETIEFPGPSGPVAVRTLPRPLQKELPLWVTTAGNIDTFIEAGKAGHNLLTHLLGQSFDDVKMKVRAYRQARSAAGHPTPGVVSLMLHTFVGPDAATVERIVHEPLKAYLKSAMFLVKAAAWQFPTFKKLSEEQGRTLDDFISGASGEDLDALLEFAFQRYFHSSGLFGTPTDCLEVVEKVASAGVDEIACLIDFGIDTDIVLNHLGYLNELRASVHATLSTDRDQPDDDESIGALLQRHKVTHLQCTPSMATMLVSDQESWPGLASLDHLLVGGEALSPDLARRLVARVGGRVTNMYGPTETTVWSSSEDLRPETLRGTGAVSIGKPLPGQVIYILDERQKMLPPGLVGEIVIGGSGVVRGYWRREQLTEERFPEDTFSGAGRMYRTGDRGRYLQDGSIEYLGRLDQQVKMRGYRIELGEIESLLNAHESVAEAVVLLREFAPGDNRLVAYIRCAEEKIGPDAKELREWAARQLPEFMIPSEWLYVHELPLTPNGKIDRRALPPPVRAGAENSPPIMAGGSEIEEMVAAVWEKTLGVSNIGRRSNFFDIGGHSLLVVQVLNELRGKVSKPVKMTDLFKYTTIESLAAFLSDSGSSDRDRGRKRAEARRAAIDRRRR